MVNSVDLSKLSDAVKNEVVKKTVYDQLVKKVNAIETNDTSNLVKKAGYNTKIFKFEENTFAPMLSSLILDSNKKVTNWILTRISSKKIKPFDTNLELIMSNFANGRVTLKFNNLFLVQKGFSSLYSKFILNVYIVYELNNWPRNPTNNFPLKIKISIVYIQISEKYNQK